ncbi:hypothetical protein RJT34_33152 [Clitoria ternatea]|uniref:Molybdenum cofactor sulfurase n=1 Tax=Clitoria ternatea TaxID=43366 RepID=A0AAN9EXA7_CLITE
MHSSSGTEEASSSSSSQPCFNGCFPSPLLATSHNNTPNSRHNKITASHQDFITATSSTLHPHTHFTNHESLPPLNHSYISFTKAFPQFPTTSQIDQIRDQEYHHLNHSNTCFDYTGYGLFSYAQQQSSCPATSQAPFFDISYKSVSLQSQILYGGHESEIESRIRKRIMRFMNVSEADYTLVFVANEVSAFKIVADSFPFQSNGELLTVYDHSSEALDVMIESCKKQGVQVLSAEFSWPNFGLGWRKLKKMIVNRREKRKNNGLFVFPLHSRVTGAPYSYVWMSMAQENGWRVLLDVCALKPKEMGTLGMSLFKPDFMVCSFYKVFGENPSGFGCLFVKKSCTSALKDPANATSIGIISVVPSFKQPQFHDESTVATEENEPKAVIETEIESEIVELTVSKLSIPSDGNRLGTKNGSLEIDCRGLDHADSMGLLLISNRTKYLINWLVNALMSLKHPHHENKPSLIRIYGPKITSLRGPAVAFNIFDWKGEKVDPALVQKLADRNNISLRSSVLKNIRFSDRNEEVRQRALETSACKVDGLGMGLSKKTSRQDSGVFVVTAALGLLTNFEDIYRLWAFLSKFLDADFVEKERWRYMALNQMTLEV